MSIMTVDITARDRALFHVFGQPRGALLAPKPELVRDVIGDPVDARWRTIGVYVFDAAGGAKAFVTAGLSELGYELCIESANEAWATECLTTLLVQQVASAVGRRPARPITPDQWIPLRPMLPVPETTKMRALAATRHARSPLSTGAELVQLVGMTKRELAWLVAESVSLSDYLERVARQFGLRTDLARPDIDVPDIGLPESKRYGS